MYYGGGDGIYIVLLLIIMMVGVWAQSNVKRTFQKYSTIPLSSNAPASEVARNLLRMNNSYVTLVRVQGELTDHFNPRTSTVGLSDSVYSSSSIAAVAVAAHEIGHVMQHENGYLPIKLRNLILPVASLGSKAGPIIVLIGMALAFERLAMLGVLLFGAAFLFQIITLPVEFNASSRALQMLESAGYISYDERAGAKRVLSAAAMTYVVAALSTLVTLLRYMSLANRSRRR